MSMSAEWAAADEQEQRRRRDALLTVFVPGPLRNPQNGPRGRTWWAQAAVTAAWRGRTAQRARVAVLMRPGPRIESQTPKALTFTVYTARAWDDDEGVNAACKPVRDGLIDGGVIHGDGPESGHTFTYRQTIGPGRRGVDIIVEARGESAGASEAS
jgi:hypothetical protein